MLKNLSKYWFMLGLPLAVGLAWWFPQIGASGGWLKTELTTKLAVAVVFLVQGLTLPGRALGHGVRQGRLHGGVQGFCFLLFPLMGLALDAMVGSRLAPDLRTGFLFLCVLPSTIMMAVMLVAVAGGNVAAAIFNAVLANVLGVFLTPLWVAGLMRSTGEMGSLGSVLREVCLLLLVPLVIGQIGRQVGAKSWADQHRKRLNHCSNGIILVIVYAAFCNSVQADIWSAQGWSTTGQVAAGVAMLLFLALQGTGLMGRALGLAPGERIVLTISGAQKSLATGIPLANLIFGPHPGLGLILLPIMIYHPTQLLVCGWIAARHEKRHPVAAA